MDDTRYIVQSFVWNMFYYFRNITSEITATKTFTFNLNVHIQRALNGIFAGEYNGGSWKLLDKCLDFIKEKKI